MFRLDSIGTLPDLQKRIYVILHHFRRDDNFVAYSVIEKLNFISLFSLKPFQLVLEIFQQSISIDLIDPK